MSLHTQMSPHIHLTHQQLCDLLIATPEETSPQLERLREHLRDCPACADEFASIRQPLERFHSATTAWAGHNAASRSWTLPALPASIPFAPFRRQSWVASCDRCASSCRRNPFCDSRPFVLEPSPSRHCSNLAAIQSHRG